MKRLLVVLVLLTSVGCSRSKRACGWTFDPIGVTDDEIPGVTYKVNKGDVVLAVVFVETVIAPLYVAFWDIREPVAVDCALVPKTPPDKSQR